MFDTLSCVIENKTSNDLVFKGFRIENVYRVDLYGVSMHGTKCLVAKSEESWLWHRCLTHVHFHW